MPATLHPFRKRRPSGRPFFRGPVRARIAMPVFAVMAMAAFAFLGIPHAGGTLPAMSGHDRIDLQETASLGHETHQQARGGELRIDRVIDGDTVRVAGLRVAVRLVGFNAPETRNPACDREAKLGHLAKERLRQLAASPGLRFERIACSCAPGTEGTGACNHGRACGMLTIDGRDAGAILIAEGLAAPYSCGRHACPPLPRPWCD